MVDVQFKIGNTKQSGNDFWKSARDTQSMGFDYGPMALGISIPSAGGIGSEDGNRLLVAVVLPDLETTQEGVGVLAETDVVRNLVGMLGQICVTYLLR